MKNIGAVKEFFDARAVHWDEMCHHDPQKLAAIVTLAQVKSGTRILDIACGTGVLHPELLARDPAEIVGVDLSDRMIALARGKNSDPRVHLYTCDFTTWQGSGFDVALLYSAYPHFQDKSALARRVYDCLAPDGRFLVAHSESRATINGRHGGPEVFDVSTELRPVEEEIKLWTPYFQIDVWADNEDIYLFSGKKREK